MKKNKFLSRLLICLFTVPSSFAFADVYRYAGTGFECRLEADRQEIGQSVKPIGPAKIQTFAFQIFASDVYTPRMTAFLQGLPAVTSDFFMTGGIPNTQAQLNWSILENRTSFASNIKDAGRNWLQFVIGTDTLKKVNVIEARLQLPWELADYQDILLAFGDKQTPDFKTDPPVVDRSDLRPTQVARTEIAFTESPSPLSVGVYNPQVHEATLSTVQIHYPAEKHNGLSYHIRLMCRPN